MFKVKLIIKIKVSVKVLATFIYLGIVLKYTYKASNMMNL